MINAIQAMPDGGTLGRDRAGHARGRAWSGAAEQAFVVLEVTDTGVGIPAGIATRSSSRSSRPRKGRGPGLGLAVCHGIVKDHDGWIEVDGPPEAAARCSASSCRRRRGPPRVAS